MTAKQLWESRVVKADHKTAGNELVFVRSGHVYETFDGHAKIASRTLGLALTARDGLVAAGFPFHHCDAYTAKLVAAGFRVALIEPEAADVIRQPRPQVTDSEGRGIPYLTITPDDRPYTLHGF